MGTLGLVTRALVIMNIAAAVLGAILALAGGQALAVMGMAVMGMAAMGDIILMAMVTANISADLRNIRPKNCRHEAARGFLLNITCSLAACRLEAAHVTPCDSSAPRKGSRP